MAIEVLRAEISALREQLRLKEEQLQKLISNKLDLEKTDRVQQNKLTNGEISRFSRQIIIPQIGVKGQLAIKHSSVLIVGAGGLGCPSALYLAGAGVGHIGIVDYDGVEPNNLHRQLLHSECSVGQSKVQSAAEALRRLNSGVTVSPYHVQLDSKNALDLVKQYDIVVDATDNVATRYLLNDACVLMKKPLVSGSALQFEGQLTVYNHNGGPCYRCLYPVPPPPETVTNCGDGGVIGAVPGVIGVLQALEAIKIILKFSTCLSGRLLVFDGANCSFRNVHLRGRSSACNMCGDNANITGLIDYEQFCGARANDKDHRICILKDEDRISPTTYSAICQKKEPHILIDVRPAIEFEICHLNESLNIPFDELHKPNALEKLKTDVAENIHAHPDFPVIVVCRRGNNSQKAVSLLRKELSSLKVDIKDIIGGLHNWSQSVDPTFPVY